MDQLTTGRSAAAHGFTPRPQAPRIVGFKEAVATAFPEHAGIVSRITDIDTEIAARQEALLRAKTARADAQFARQLGVSADAAADAWMKGETLATPAPNIEQLAVQVGAPSEEVLLGLQRRIDSLQQERGVLVAKIRAMRIELVTAFAHDTASRYIETAEQLMREFALLSECGQILGVQTLGIAPFRMAIPGLGDKFRHGATEVQGLLHDPESYRSTGGFSRARATIENAVAEFRSL